MSTPNHRLVTFLTLWDEPATLLDLHISVGTASYTTLTSALGRLHKKGLIRRERDSRLTNPCAHNEPLGA